MAQIKLAEYTFNNSVGDCLPTLTPNTITMTKEDSISGTTTRRIVYIDDSVLPTAISFNSKSSLLTVEYLRVDSNIITMKQMFSSCSRLTSLDVSNFNTEKVTNMYQMFYDCSKLTSLDLSNFNTEKVTNMNNILTNTPSLTNIGAVYCNSSTINKISNLVTTNATIWYTDAKLEDLIVKDNITYKEYKSNILTVNEDVTLRSNGNVYDELNLLTGRLTQRIDENNEVLAQEVVKTVDLSSNTVYAYNGTTHYTCSSEEGSLIPTACIEVPVETETVE